MAAAPRLAGSGSFSSVGPEPPAGAAGGRDPPGLRACELLVEEGLLPGTLPASAGGGRLVRGRGGRKLSPADDRGSCPARAAGGNVRRSSAGLAAVPPADAGGGVAERLVLRVLAREGEASTSAVASGRSLPVCAAVDICQSRQASTATAISRTTTAIHSSVFESSIAMGLEGQHGRTRGVLRHVALPCQSVGSKASWPDAGKVQVVRRTDILECVIRWFDLLGREKPHKNK